MPSAPTAIIEPFRCAVARRTRARRPAGDMGPTGRSTKAGATRLPGRSACPSSRTETGTRARSTRPRVGSRREASSSWRVPAMAVSTRSFTVPPRARRTSRRRRKGTSAMAKRRSGRTGTSKGPGGGRPMRSRSPTPRTAPASPAAARAGARAAWKSASSGSARASRRASRSSSPPEGAGLGRQRLGRSSAGGVASRSNRAEAMRMAEIPSAMAWWTLSRAATRPPSRPSRTCSSHRGRVRSRGRESTRATTSASSRRPPGAGSAVRCRWKSRSNRSSSTHTGRARFPGTGRTRCLRRGARWRRASRVRRTSSKGSRPSGRVEGSSRDTPATCMGVDGRSRYRKEASRLDRRSATAPPR